ncbi:MAG TPA: hypothetical protein VJ801_16385 [Polyangia bacterium]|nr:hypothetical protein [Polyangia bacterium]
MSLKRVSRAQLPRSTGPACVLLFGLGGAFGCSAYPTFRDVPINCKVDTEPYTAYEFDPNTVPPEARCDRDSTPDAGQIAAQVELIEGGGRCDSHQALVLRVSHNNDWGANCQFTSFVTDHLTNPDGSWQYFPRDESPWEGLSFWARAPGNTSKGFTLSLDDANTWDSKAGVGAHCKIYNAADGGLGGSTINAAIDPTTNQVVSGSAIASRLPDECGNNKGNSYTDVVTVTSEWAFYTIPWNQFTQQAYPNRVPNSVLTETGNVPGTGLLPNKLFGLSLRPAKEAPFELWIDQMRFYRKKGHGPGADAGSDALAASADAGLNAPAAGADAEPDATQM